MNESDVIARYFRPLTQGRPEALGLMDDAALVSGNLVVTTDTINEGVHFLGHEAPGLIARKLLRVNLSDLAGKGTEPYCYFLNLSLPNVIGSNWIAAFAEGLREDQERFGIFLAGGDTTNTRSGISLSLTAIGKPGAGGMLQRSDGRPGDLLYVSGTIGDSALGLRMLLDASSRVGEEEKTCLTRRYLLPEPRLPLGVALRGIARACMDTSDGLAQDLSHLCHASGCGARINAEKIPLSPVARKMCADDKAMLPALLTGGDDYELLFSVPGSKKPKIREVARRLGIALTCIGVLTEQQEEVFTWKGQPMVLNKKGYQHRF